MDARTLEGRSADELTETIRQLHALRCAVQAALLEVVAAFDAAGHWGADGARSMAGWMTAYLGVSSRTASDEVAVAGRLRDLPEVAQAFGCGALSFDQVRAVSELATPSSQAEVLEEARGLSARALAVLARRAREVTVACDQELFGSRRLRMRWELDSRC